jgi:hypothetical protein
MEEKADNSYNPTDETLYKKSIIAYAGISSNQQTLLNKVLIDYKNDKIELLSKFNNMMAMQKTINDKIDNADIRLYNQVVIQERKRLNKLNIKQAIFYGVIDSAIVILLVTLAFKTGFIQWLIGI